MIGLRSLYVGDRRARHALRGHHVRDARHVQGAHHAHHGLGPIRDPPSGWSTGPLVPERDSPGSMSTCLPRSRVESLGNRNGGTAIVFFRLVHLDRLSLLCRLRVRAALHAVGSMGG